MGRNRQGVDLWGLPPRKGTSRIEIQSVEYNKQDAKNMKTKFYLQITTRSFRQDGRDKRSKPVGKIIHIKQLKTPDDFEDLPDTKQWVVEVTGEGRQLTPLVCKERECTDGYDVKTSRVWVNAKENEHTHPFIVMKGSLYPTFEAAADAAKRMRVYYVK